MRSEKSVRSARGEALVGALDAGFLKQNGFLLPPGGTPHTLDRFGFWGNAIRNTGGSSIWFIAESAAASFPGFSAIHDFLSDAFITRAMRGGRWDRFLPLWR
jgi:hypothetical protein